MALTEVTLSGGAVSGGKPRLSAVSTADYLPINGDGVAGYSRFLGPYYEALSAPRIYNKIEIPLQNAAAHVGVTLNIYIAQVVAGQLVVRQKYQHVIAASDTLITWGVDLEFGAGESWGILFGVLEGGETDHTGLFYGTFPGGYPAPHPGGKTVRISDGDDFPVGAQIALDPTTASSRTLRLYGSSQPKGVTGPADKTDITFSGSTANRPVGAPTGFCYFDTTLAKPVWWGGNAWLDSSGAAV